MEKAKAESELWDTTTKIQKVDEELRQEQDQAETPDGDADGSTPLLTGSQKVEEAEKVGKLSKRQRNNLQKNRKQKQKETQQQVAAAESRPQLTESQS